MAKAILKGNDSTPKQNMQPEIFEIGSRPPPAAASAIAIATSWLLPRLNIAAYLGLTPSQYASGATQRQGRISKQGLKQARYLLVEAATVLLTRCKARSGLWAWGMKLWKKKGERGALDVARN
jgi:transposase